MKTFQGAWFSSLLLQASDSISSFITFTGYKRGGWIWVSKAEIVYIRFYFSKSSLEKLPISWGQGRKKQPEMHITHWVQQNSRSLISILVSPENAERDVADTQRWASDTWRWAPDSHIFC